MPDGAPRAGYVTVRVRELGAEAPEDVRPSSAGEGGGVTTPRDLRDRRVAPRTTGRGANGRRSPPRLGRPADRPGPGAPGARLQTGGPRHAICRRAFASSRPVADDNALVAARRAYVRCFPTRDSS